jgi:hypothetical protein
MIKRITAGFLIFFIALFSMINCKGKPENNDKQGTDMNNQSGKNTEALSSIVDKITALGYRELFQNYDQKDLDSIWNEDNAAKKLSSLAINPEMPPLACFLAAEIMFLKQEEYPPQDHKKQLSVVYATALTQNFTESANTWGLPNIQIGDTEIHFIALGEAAIPELTHLLENNSRVYYAGSQEATLGNAYGYRIKDLAAYYISKITNLVFEIDQDPRKRDESIKRLKSVVQ